MGSNGHIRASLRYYATKMPTKVASVARVTFAGQRSYKQFRHDKSPASHGQGIFALQQYGDTERKTLHQSRPNERYSYYRTPDKLIFSSPFELLALEQHPSPSRS